MRLSKKIDFAVIIRVMRANPNGDPLNGNRPRITYDNIGEISDVCLKRKIRNRLMEKGHKIFVQSDDNRIDEYPCLHARAASVISSKSSHEEIIEKTCKEWFDVRAFGQLFAFKGEEKEKKKEKGVSVGIRGPVSIHPAFSLEKVEIISTQITKSVNSEGDGRVIKSSDTMGMKHYVEKGIYVFYGSMNPQLSVKTGFSDEDAQAIKEVLPKLFENDESSSRPAGSMSVLKVVWWGHNCPSGQLSSAKVHGSLKIHPDGSIEIDDTKGPIAEIIEGF